MTENLNLSTSEEYTLASRGYKLVKKLGEGSYAKVYMAEYTTPGGSDLSSLACKIIDTEKAPKDFVRKFLPRELAILVRLNHPHIIHVHSIFQRRSKYFIFMRCAELGDVLDFVLKNGAVSESQVWFRQIALAVQYLHELEVAHRDLKCENILITTNFNVKVADFGFARDVVDSRGKRVLSETYCGSLSYAAPEILVGAPYNPKIADVWASGVVLYVMLNKAMPFDDTHVKRLYDQEVSRKWKFRAKVADVLSDQLKSLISNLLEPEVNKRWRMDHVIVSDWIAMDERLLKMSLLESEAYRLAAEERQRRFDTVDERNARIGWMTVSAAFLLQEARNKQGASSAQRRTSASILLKAAEQAAAGKGADVNVIKDVRQIVRADSPEAHSVADMKKKGN